MTTGTRRRPNNSLSYQKFINRLDRGLPIFVAYGNKRTHVIRSDNCRDLHWYPWRYPTPKSSGGEFIYVSRVYPTFVHEGHESLRDMNVMRNRSNKNFAFRTRKAAEQYLQDIA